MESLAVVIAHQGGWDEILMVLAPVAIVAWLLRLAKRRVSRAEEAAAGDHPTGEVPADASPPSPDDVEHTPRPTSGD